MDAPGLAVVGGRLQHGLQDVERPASGLRVDERDPVLHAVTAVQHRLPPRAPTTRRNLLACNNSR